MPTNIFSTYSTGENRVTASILAVLQSLSLERIERLLAALLEQSEFELVRFQNQPSRGGLSVPDAVISASCRVLVETKIKPGAVKDPQLREHLKRLDKASETTCVLLVLSPDDQQPKALESIGDDRLVWASFAALDQSIDELLTDAREVVSEREAFLLRELQTMLTREHLVASVNDVVVVPARHAWPEYQRHHAYICQPDRPFRPVTRIAFYTLGQVYPLVPRILETHDRVEFVRDEHKGQLGKLVNALLDDPGSKKAEGVSYKVMLLSAPDSAETLELEQPVYNDLKTETGRTTAFTQNQRYVSAKRLKEAKMTSQLTDK